MLTLGIQNKKLGFRQSKIEPCVLFKKDEILLIWVDNCIVFNKDLSVITEIINLLKENFDVELEEDANGGDVLRYLSMAIQRNKDKSFEIKQPFLIDGILALLEIDDNVNSKLTLVSKTLLHKDKKSTQERDLRIIERLLGC